MLMDFGSVTTARRKIGSRTEALLLQAAEGRRRVLSAYSSRRDTVIIAAYHGFCHPFNRCGHRGVIYIPCCACRRMRHRTVLCRTERRSFSTCHPTAPWMSGRTSSRSAPLCTRWPSTTPHSSARFKVCIPCVHHLCMHDTHVVWDPSQIGSSTSCREHR